MSQAETHASRAPLPAVRAARRADLQALEAVIEAADLFPRGLLGDMMKSYLTGRAKSDEIWLTFDEPVPHGVAFCAPEMMTEDTWNLYLIAVHTASHRQGRGATLLRAIEAALRARRGRLLLVETSGLPDFSAARAFYRGKGFAHVATLPDFYSAGNDKLVFTKYLRRAAEPG